MDQLLALWAQSTKKEGKDQESIQSSTTPDPGYQYILYGQASDPVSVLSEVVLDGQASDPVCFIRCATMVDLRADPLFNLHK